MTDDGMKPEYDFSKMEGGVRGKYAKAFRAGHTVKIEPEDGYVMLEPDVRKYFPDSESVNHALRCLIPLVSAHRENPKKPGMITPSVSQTE